MFPLFLGVVITSATTSTTSITVFWEPYSPRSNSIMQASCCKVEQPGMCSNNEVRITNGNVSVDGLEEFTNYSCRIARFSAPFVATTLSDSKYMCCYSLQAECWCVNNSHPFSISCPPSLLFLQSLLPLPRMYSWCLLTPPPFAWCGDSPQNWGGMGSSLNI